MRNPRLSQLLRRLRFSELSCRDAPITANWAAIGWWESRRIPFNLIVGVAGLVTCLVVGILALASSILFGIDFGLPDPPIFAVLGVFLYAVGANICYTFGWLIELLIRKFWPQEADRFATQTFSIGLVFSTFLTLCPAVLISISACFALFRHFHHPVPN